MSCYQNCELKMFVFLMLCAVLRGTGAVIYRLNDSDYARMPPAMHMDSYETCRQDAGALYCSAEFVLVSDKPSPLMDMIKEYSEHRVTHFNHTHLHYGICVTQTCKTFYEKFNKDQKFTLEACLNESLSEEYELKVRILDEYYCMQPGKARTSIDLLDIIVAAICLTILLTNVVGTVYDIYRNKIGDNTEIRLLMCFSLKRNWNKLMAPAGVGQVPRIQLLKSIHGIRVLTTALVIMGHSGIFSVVANKSTKFVEEILTNKLFYILLNGTLIMQTFLLIAAFLLVYTSLIYSENHQVSWAMLPKQIIIRWLRLTPSYAIILALTATWFRHLTSGPLWDKFVAAEMYDCRKYWWQHIFYINNYLPKSLCMVQSWYLAVDTQLYILAVIIFLACRTARSRKIVLSSLLVIGIAITVAHIYFQDLDGILMVSPESILTLYLYDPFFNIIYTRAHTNITGYIIGMAMGFLVYHWQKQGVDFKKYQTFAYRLVCWSFFPVAALCCYSGGVFYSDAPRSSVYIRMLYAAFAKSIFTISMGIIIIASIFKIEDLYRSILEWRGWTIPSRLTYSAYLLHSVLIRSSLDSMAHNPITEVGYLSMAQFGISILIMTFVASFPFWLLVEAPCGNIIKECLLKPNEEDKKIKCPTRAKKEFKES